MMYLNAAEKNSKIVKKLTVVGIVVNVILASVKLSLGLVYTSTAILSDAVHSLADVGTSILVLLAVFIGKPQETSRFNYGREKIESLFVLFFGIFLTGVGAMLFWEGASGLFHPTAVDVNFALYLAAIFSIVLKESIFWVTIHFAKKTGSATLKADAWHHRTDSLSSVAVLIGLASGQLFASNIAENIAVLVVSLFIFKIALTVFFDAAKKLVDSATAPKTHSKILQAICQVQNVEQVQTLKTRLFGNTVFVDVKVRVDDKLTANEICELIQAVHQKLKNHPELSIKHCTVEVSAVQYRTHSQIN